MASDVPPYQQALPAPTSGVGAGADTLAPLAPLMPLSASIQNVRVRESRAVPRYSDEKENVWKAAADGILKSKDLDARFQFSPNLKPLPYQVQETPKYGQPLNPCVPCKLFRPPTDPPKPPIVTPLTSVDPRIQVMAKELRALERENIALMRTARRQESLIAAFCELFTERRSNR